MKLGRRLSHTTIWHRPWFFFNPFENFRAMAQFVTSLHATFGQKLAKFRGSVEGAVFNQNANGNNQKTQNEKLYKMVISVFLNFGCLTPKILRSRFFWKMDHVIQNFHFFQKTVTYAIQIKVVYQCTNFKSIAHFLTPKWSVLSPKKCLFMTSFFQMRWF